MPRRAPRVRAQVLAQTEAAIDDGTFADELYAEAESSGSPVVLIYASNTVPESVEVEVVETLGAAEAYDDDDEGREIAGLSAGLFFAVSISAVLGCVLCGYQPLNRSRDEDSKNSLSRPSLDRLSSFLDEATFLGLPSTRVEETKRVVSRRRELASER